MDTKKAREALRRQREALERAERQLAAIEASQASLKEKEDAWLGVAADLIRANPGPAVRGHLRRRGEYDTVKTHMQPNAADAAARPYGKPRRGRPMVSEHALPARLKVLGKTVVDVARELKVSRTTVRSWYAEGEAARAIPERFVAIFERKPYLIPRSAWTNGITD